MRGGGRPKCPATLRVGGRLIIATADGVIGMLRLCAGVSFSLLSWCAVWPSNAALCTPSYAPAEIRPPDVALAVGGNHCSFVELTLAAPGIFSTLSWGYRGECGDDGRHHRRHRHRRAPAELPSGLQRKYVLRRAPTFPNRNEMKAAAREMPRHFSNGRNNISSKSKM